MCLFFHWASSTLVSFFIAGLLEAVDVLVYVVNFQAVYFILQTFFLSLQPGNVYTCESRALKYVYTLWPRDFALGNHLEKSKF